jgi:hypothetical protein
MTRLLLHPDEIADLLEDGETGYWIGKGKPVPNKGDVLYVAENWRTEEVGGWKMLFVRDQTYKMIGLPQEMWDHAHRPGGTWKGAAKMPAWAARLWVKVHSVELLGYEHHVTLKLVNPPEMRIEKVVRKNRRNKNSTKNILEQILKP